MQACLCHQGELREYQPWVEYLLGTADEYGLLYYETTIHRTS